MKINLKLLASTLLAVLCVPCALAQITVVKQNGNQIYLDVSEYNRTVTVGDSFKIILSQEQLTNPKTGKDLGLINHYSSAGKIIEVQPLYVIGQMNDKTVYSVGQEAVIESAAPAPAAVSPAISTPDTMPLSNRKVKTYDVMQLEIISAVQADLTDESGEEIAALDAKGNLILYTADGTALQEMARTKLPVGQKPITLSVQDLMQTGHAQLFAVVYKETERKISTLVFQVQDNEFKQITVLPYFVKEVGCADQKVMYAQKPFISGVHPGNAYPLIYQDGHFRLGKEMLKTRSNWLSGINEYKIQNQDTENFVYTAYNGRLRMRLANGKFTDSPALFATASNRVKYKQDIIAFYPSLQVFGPAGNATLAGIENTAKFGLLSEQFGLYNGGKIHFLTYDNGILSVKETLPLSGFAYDTACTAHGILIPQVVSGGQTILTEIYR